ncbi:MAG: hypothetical protein KUG77_24110, partial [Nannocystaceae bacterium]|nr:hypothetical protein [Nannocystaceae bacterium]
GGSGEDSTGGEESTGPAVDPCMGIEFQQCFMTEGCTWEPMGIGMGECVTGGGGAEGGGVCEFVPVAFCDSTPGCMVDGDECVEG